MQRNKRGKSKKGKSRKGGRNHNKNRSKSVGKAVAKAVNKKIVQFGKTNAAFAAIKGGVRPPRMPPKGRSGRSAATLAFSDYVQMPSLTIGSSTQTQGDVQLTPGFPQGTCVGVFDINPLTLSPISIMRTRAYTFRKFRCNKLKAEFVPYEFPGANATVTQAQYAFIWDDNPDTRFASLGQTMSLDVLRAHDADITRNFGGKYVSRCKRSEKGSKRTYHVQATTDPENYIQTTLYVFQTAAALSTGTNLAVGKLFISGDVYFSEPTLTAIPGSIDIVNKVATYSNTNYWVSPTVTGSPTTSTILALPSIANTPGYQSGSNLGVGFAWNSTDSEYVMSFPYPGNYLVIFNIAGISGTPNASGTLVGWNGSKTSVASVSNTTTGNVFVNATAVSGTISIAEVFYINVTAPNQVIEFTTSNLGLTFASTNQNCVTVTYQSTGFAGLPIGGLGSVKLDRISQLEEKFEQLFCKGQKFQMLECKDDPDPMLTCQICQQTTRCLHQSCLSQYHSSGHPNGMFFCQYTGGDSRKWTLVDEPESPISSVKSEREEKKKPVSQPASRTASLKA